MKIKSKQKRKSSDTKPSVEGSWSKVKIAGNLITNDGGGLEGLVGLEVLETYDKNIISKAKVRNCNWGLTFVRYDGILFAEIEKARAGRQ